MTTTHELQPLLDRVRAATGADRELDKLLSAHFGTKNDFGVTIVLDRWLGIAPFTASTDAVLTLTERVLPGCQIAMGTCGENDGPWACITEPDEPCADYSDGSSVDIPNALLAATLSALIARASA